MTIEERAKIYADNKASEWLTATTRQVIWGRAYKDYISIATEQRAIDINEQIEEMRQLNEEWEENLAIQRQMLTDKACEILRNNGTFAKIAEEEGVTTEMVENTFKKMSEDKQ